MYGRVWGRSRRGFEWRDNCIYVGWNAMDQGYVYMVYDLCSWVGFVCTHCCIITNENGYGYGLMGTARKMSAWIHLYC